MRLWSGFSSGALFVLGIWIGIAGMQGCAHLPAGKGVEPTPLFEDACRAGRENQSVKGAVWMSLRSKEEKGQFPASVNAEAPDKVVLEVTNLIGSREALIQVADGSYTIDVPKKGNRGSRHGSGSGSWGGIPLQWASELFLGRVPCPGGPREGVVLEVTPEGDLNATSKAAGERFVYHFRQWAGRPWPEKLHWEKLGDPNSAVDFQFDEPDDKTGSPKKWEAHSAIRGEVKVRWTELQISTSK